MTNDKDIFEMTNEEVTEELRRYFEEPEKAGKKVATFIRPLLPDLRAYPTKGPFDIEQAQQAERNAGLCLSDLCHARRRWEMHIPLQEDDPDVIFGAALRQLRHAITEVEQLRTQVEMLKASFWIAHRGFHLGDPCMFCGVAHDEVLPGECDGHLVQLDMAPLMYKRMK